jgi:hypothetical protein
MRQRCSNPNTRSYPAYGGAGVKICKRWDKFTNFLADMGVRKKGMTLSRSLDSGDYKPSNCSWATEAGQRRQRRLKRLRRRA